MAAVQNRQQPQQQGDLNQNRQCLKLSKVNMPSGNRISVTVPAKPCRCTKCNFKFKLIHLRPDGSMGKTEYNIVDHEMNSTIRQHRLQERGGGRFTSYSIVSVHKVQNNCLWRRFREKEKEIYDQVGYVNVKMLFHGTTSTVAETIVKTGFNKQYAKLSGMFGTGIYFADLSSKSNQYAYGYLGGNGCDCHKDKNCYNCVRKILLCRVALGQMYKLKSGTSLQEPPTGYHSVYGEPSRGGLMYPEYTIYNDDQFTKPENNSKMGTFDSRGNIISGPFYDDEYNESNVAMPSGMKTSINAPAQNGAPMMSLKSRNVDFQETWGKLKQTVAEVVALRAVERCVWNACFSEVYALCVAQPEPLADRLYDETRNFLEEHVSGLLEIVRGNSPLENSDHNDGLLRRYVAVWRQYSQGVENLNKMYSYLNLQHVKKQKVGEVGLLSWERVLIRPLAAALSSRIVSALSAARAAAPPDGPAAATLRHAIQSTVHVQSFRVRNPLALYQKLVLEPYLARLSRDVPHYINHALEGLEKDVALARRFLDASSVEAVRACYQRAAMVAPAQPPATRVGTGRGRLLREASERPEPHAQELQRRDEPRRTDALPRSLTFLNALLQPLVEAAWPHEQAPPTATHTRDEFSDLNDIIAAAAVQNRQQPQRQRRFSKVNLPSGKPISVTIPAKPCVCTTCTFKFELFLLRPDGGMRFSNKREYNIVAHEMKLTIQHHKRGGGRFTSYSVDSVHKVVNSCLWRRFKEKEKEIYGQAGYVNEKMLFHGTTSRAADKIVKTGFDKKYAKPSGMFGTGIYFAEHSSKSNQYTYGPLGGNGCRRHKDKNCYNCVRKILLCRVALGKMYKLKTGNSLQEPPTGYHSVYGEPSTGGLQYPEYIIYNDDQIYPEYLIEYKIVK